MTKTPEQIDRWCSSSSEAQHLEFKEAKMQFDNRRLYRYCVAIANEGGGYLVLGVTDKSPRSVVGTAAFNNPIEMAAKLFQVVGFRVDIEDGLPKICPIRAVLGVIAYLKWSGLQRGIIR